MSSHSAGLDQQLASTIRQRRAELRGCMSRLELALSAPSAGRHDAWLRQVRTALTALTDGLAEHVTITEGPAGLYKELIESAPRLAGPVAQLTAEHAHIDEQLSGLVKDAGEPDADVESIRDSGTQLLDQLMRHRQRGADLVFEAYEFDVGGSG